MYTIYVSFLPLEQGATQPNWVELNFNRPQSTEFDFRTGLEYMAICFSLTESRHQPIHVRACSMACNMYQFVMALSSRNPSFQNQHSLHANLCSNIISVTRESVIESILLAFLSNFHVTRLESKERKISSSNWQGTPSSRSEDNVCVRAPWHATFHLVTLDLVREVSRITPAT